MRDWDPLRDLILAGADVRLVNEGVMWGAHPSCDGNGSGGGRGDGRVSGFGYGTGDGEGRGDGPGQEDGPMSGYMGAGEGDGSGYCSTCFWEDEGLLGLDYQWTLGSLSSS